jgi:hypothetical protein
MLRVRVRIVDRTKRPTIPRALTVSTTPSYRQIGLADAVVDRGRKMAAISLWITGKQVAHAVIGDMGGNVHFTC